MRSTEFITDDVNPAVFKRGFEKDSAHVGKTNKKQYTLKAKHGALPYIPGKKATVSDQFRIEAYDGASMIAWVNFEQKGNNLEAIDLVVDPKHRRQGIASAMYEFAKSFNNTVVPSSKQTPDGKAFWQGKQK